MDLNKKVESLFPEIDFMNGIVMYNGFDDETVKSNDLKSLLLSEDLLKIKYSDDMVLDIGWYGFEMFAIHIIKNDNWETPLERRISKDIISLKLNMQECISNIEYLTKISSSDNIESPIL